MSGWKWPQQNECKRVTKTPGGKTRESGCRHGTMLGKFQAR